MTSAHVTGAQAGCVYLDLGGARGGSGITGVEVILARVETNDGLEAWGFSYVLRGHRGASLAAARDAVAVLVGKPVPHPEAAWRRAVAGFNRTGGGPNLVGLAAIDVALWDLWGKVHGRSIAALLGGGEMDRPVYASSGFSPGQDPEEAAEHAKAAITAGYCGVKPRLAGRSADLLLLQRVRAAIGSDALLLGDANEKLDLSQAMTLARDAVRSGLDYLEEPLPASDLDGLRRLARASTLAIAGGEHFQDDLLLLPVLKERLLSLVQPDLAMMGGLTPCLRVARAAELFGVKVSPHFLPGLFVQLASACPALSMLEDFPLIEPLFDGWPEVRGGRMRATARPGHGLHPTGHAIEEFRRSG